jgi:hypothetical protein
MSLSRASWLALVASVACASVPAPQRMPSEIERAEVVPRGYVALGTARASCSSAPAWGALDAEPLTRFECRTSTLERAVAEQAAARGGSLLAGMRCRASDVSLACTATVAGPEDGTTPLAAPSRAPAVPRDELTFETARKIAVDLAPETQRFGRRVRGAEEVAVQRTVPVSHRSLGSLAVRCDKKDCDHDNLRVALRVAAGALGVSDVAEVACGVRRDDAFCVATLAAAELDPETDPRAR